MTPGEPREPPRVAGDVPVPLAPQPSSGRGGGQGAAPGRGEETSEEQPCSLGAGSKFEDRESAGGERKGHVYSRGSGPQAGNEGHTGPPPSTAGVGRKLTPELHRRFRSRVPTLPSKRHPSTNLKKFAYKLLCKWGLQVPKL